MKRNRNAVEKAVDVYLAASGMTQANFASSLGMSAETLRSKLRKPGNFKVSEADALCDAIGWSIGELTACDATA